SLLEVNSYLINLIIENCPQIGDSSISAIQGRVLNRAFFSGCPRITDQGIQYLNQLPLNLCMIQNCPGVTLAKLNRVKSGHVFYL
ncbi:MAG: hypothetical protein V4487_00355, partial [Chlamydiota bacterium]